ncbi:MAG: magnesium and cobalt transport protein CorA [Leucobacter sp.]
MKKRSNRHGQAGIPSGEAAIEPQQRVSFPPLTRYVTDGVPEPAPEDATFADHLAFAESSSDRMTMTLVPLADAEIVNELAAAWQLHPTLQEDLLEGTQRPKLERHGDVLFIALRSAWYIDKTEDVEFAEFHVLMRHNAIVVLCHEGKWIDGTPALRIDDQLTRRFHTREKHPFLDDQHLLRLGPEAVMYRLLDAVVDGYAPVMRGIAVDKEQIERQVFSGDSAVAERIYRLSQEVIGMQHTTGALTEVMQEIRAGFVRYGIHEELREYLQDVADHLELEHSRVLEYRASLAQILEVNSSLVAQRQNDDMKKISGWAAVLFAPSLIGAIYGMNFDTMPELHWGLGYPIALLLMLALAVVLYIVFKVRKWM